MRTAFVSAFIVSIVLVDPAFAAQGPGASDGTATPLMQWMAVLCAVAFPTLGVIFSAWDDGHYADFSSGLP